MKTKICALTFLIGLSDLAFAQSPGEAELARCLAARTMNCDFALIAEAYDGIVPPTIARPDSKAEGSWIFTTCVTLSGSTRMSYSSPEILELAKTVLSKGVCKGDINNLYYKPLD